VYQLPEVYPERSVALTYPYDLPPGEYVPGEPYADVIDGWCRDPSQRPFASHLAIFMAQILRTLHAQGYSQATIDQYARSFEAIGWLLCQYGSYDALTRDLFQGAPPFEDEFRREISSAKTALQQYRRAWRMLGRWAYELDETPLDPAMPDASASVES